MSHRGCGYAEVFFLFIFDFFQVFLVVYSPEYFEDGTIAFCWFSRVFFKDNEMTLKKVKEEARGEENNGKECIIS